MSAEMIQSSSLILDSDVIIVCEPCAADTGKKKDSVGGEANQPSNIVGIDRRICIRALSSKT
jgi:hypothetical protein